MTKRIGNLFDECFSIDSLLNAYKHARKGKRKTKSVYHFEKKLGVNIQKLHNELMSGNYDVQGYKTFIIKEPKQRVINAPAFRDVIVQHAIYKVINPLFDKTFIYDNYGCRIGKGTHKASNKTQENLRKSKKDSYILQLDIRKFYYSINHSIIKLLIEKKIKDKRLVNIIMKFVGNDHIGIPIGNLLSQLFGIIYLNPLDHFIKRDLKINRYVRYVDDFICWLKNKKDCLLIKSKIEDFLKAHLFLELSKWKIAPVKKGVNFVGYRTWRSKRFVRKRCLYNFNKKLKQKNKQSIISILGHAKETSSLKYMLNKIKQSGMVIA